ncbi:MAG: flagellar hook-associated protein FlgK [Candidatus Kapabacteria bacterium]|nr:flagellar hook-associated protein FlgK [Candidatus Kapabacteria bacterium]
MSTFSALEIGKRSLLAQRFGIDVTSNNISNVNTPGYSRQAPVISESDPYLTSNGFIGTGSFVDKLRTFREEYFDKEVRKSVSQQSSYEADQATLHQVDAYLTEPSSSGLNETLTNFFNSWEQASTQPENEAIRATLTSSAKALVSQFHSISGDISDARASLLTKMNQSTDQINSLLSDIGKLNGYIAAGKAQTQGTEAQTLVDNREVKLEELSKLVNINVTQGDFGQVNVFVNGINLVTAQNASKLKILQSINQNTGEITASMVNVDSNEKPLSTVVPQSGEMASNIKHYNTTLDDKESGSEFSIAKKVDDLAAALAQKVNAFTMNGYGLNDKSGPPPGRHYFDSSTGPITASTIEISSDIINEPRNIPMSEKPNEPGNAGIALKIGRLATDTSFLDGKSPSQFYSTVITKLGSMEHDANNGQTASKLITDQLQTQRESVIGVNLDEEATNVIKFQKAFEAASRIISTTNDMLSTIINLGR